MKSTMVSYTRETLPPITEAEREQLKKLATLKDSEIDTSDIPEITPEQAKGAVRGWENHPGRARNRSRPAA
jgi:hypothetical protein